MCIITKWFVIIERDGQARRGVASYSLAPRLTSLKIWTGKIQMLYDIFLDLVYTLGL